MFFSGIHVKFGEIELWIYVKLCGFMFVIHNYLKCVIFFLFQDLALFKFDEIELWLYVKLCGFIFVLHNYMESVFAVELM